MRTPMPSKISGIRWFRPIATATGDRFAGVLRRGDRVVVNGSRRSLAKELKRQTAKTVELKSLNPEHPDRTIPMQEVRWIARILWSTSRSALAPGTGATAGLIEPPAICI